MATKKKKTQDTSPLAMGRQQKGSAANKKASKDTAKTVKTGASKVAETAKTATNRSTQSSVSSGSRSSSSGNSRAGNARGTFTGSTNDYGKRTSASGSTTQQRAQTPAQSTYQKFEEDRKKRMEESQKRMASSSTVNKASSYAEQKTARNKSIEAQTKQAQNNVRKSAPTAKQMMEQREQNKQAAKNNKQEWNTVKNQSKDKQREWFNQKMAEASERRGTGYESFKEKNQDTAAGRIISNASERWGTRQKRILTETGVALSDIGYMANKGEETKGGRLSQDMAGLLPDREKSREAYKQGYRDYVNKRNQRESELEKYTANAKGFEKTYYGAEDSLQGMLSDYIMGAALGGRWEIPLALRTYGGQRGKAKEQGATTTEDRLNAAKDSIIEVATEKIGGFMGAARLTPDRKIVRGLSDRIAGKVAQRFSGVAGRDALSGAGRLMRNALEENVEEWIANPAENFGENVIWRNRVQAQREAENDAYFNDVATSIQQYFNENPDNVDLYIADINSKETRDELMKEFVEGGMTEEQANKITDKMIDFMVAAARNDTETMKAIKDSLDEDLVGDVRKKVWDWNENLESFASTTLLMMATGLPGTISTTMQGKAIKDTEGSREAMINALNKVVAFAPEHSAKAQSLLDSMENGYEPTATQAYDIMQDENRVMAEGLKNQAASDSVKAKGTARENLLAPVAVTYPDGSYEIVGNVTAEEYAADYFETLDYIDTVNSYRYQGQIMDDSEAKAVATTVASYKAGTLTVAEISNLTEAHPEARDVFQQMTGVDLNSYNVADKKGNLNSAESNINMQKGLLAESAQNYIQSARAEQEAWSEGARVEAVTRMSQGLGSSGDTAAAIALEDVDPRDKGKFMLTAAAVSRVYDYARNTTDSWNEVNKKFGPMFKGVDKDAMRSAYEAAKEDKAKAETDGYGKMVKIGEKNSLKNETPAYVPGKVEIKTENKPTNKDYATLSDIADKFGLNIVLTDELDANENGRYEPKTRTIMLNSQNTMDDNLNAIFSHEVTHHLAAFAPEEYLKLSRLVMDRWYKNDEAGYKKAIAHVQALYKKVKDQDLTPEQALEEIIADNAHYIWTDEKFAEDICREEPTLAQAIINAIKDVLAKLRAVLSSGNVTDEQTQQSIFDQIGVYDDAYKLYLNAFSQAEQTRADQAIDDWQNKVNDENKPEAKNSTEAIAKEIEKEAPWETEPEFEVRHSLSAMSEAAGLEFSKQDGRTILKDAEGNEITEITPEYLKETPIGRVLTYASSVPFNVISDNEANNRLKFLSDLYNMILKTQDVDLIWAVSGTLGYNPLHLVNENTPAEKIKEQPSKFASITGNSDPQYRSTIDFTTICVKTQAVIDAMSALMKKMHRGLTEHEIIDIVYNETHNAGEQVPCPVCYVFSRWVGLGELFSKIKEFQEKYPESMDMSLIKEEYVNLQMEVGEMAESMGIRGNKAREILYKQTIERKDELDELAYFDKITDAEKKELEQINRRLEVLDNWSWLGKSRLDPKYKAVPDDILFDINAGREFATEYPSVWRFRTTRGPSLGKAAAPYTPSRLGDTIKGIASPSNLGDIGEGSRPFLTEEDWSKTTQKTFANAVANAKRQNRMNGQRLQSTSDFRFEYGLDYILSFIELEAIGAKAQMYTKVPEAVKFLASTNAEVNCSIMPLGRGVDENGNLIFSDVTGMSWADALALSKAYDNVQPILVAIGRDHLIAAMADNDVTMIIPYHASGSTESRYRSMMETVGESVEDRTDFAEYESEHDVEKATPEQKTAKKLRIAILTGEKGNKPLTEKEKAVLESNEILRQLYIRVYGKDENGESAKPDPKYVENFDNNGNDADCFGVYLTKEQAKVMMPYEYWNKKSTIKTADKQGKAYVDYCKSLGITPVFSGWDSKGKYHEEMDFTKYPGYWKTLIDRCMYNNNGKYHKQSAINLDNVDLDMLDSTQMRDEVVKPLQVNDPAKTKEIVDRAYERIKAEETKFSIAAKLDDAYMDAVNSGNMEEAQRLVNEAAKTAMSNTKTAGIWYHGTPNYGFTVFNGTGFKDHDGWYFSDRRDAAKSYEYGDEAGTYSVYLNLTNPMIIDAEGQYWSDINTYKSISAGNRVKEIDERLTELRDAWRNGTDNGEYDRLLAEYEDLVDNQRSRGDTDSWVALAKGEGHDGLVIKNIIDYGSNYEGEEYEPFTEVIAFNRSQIKSADTITYAEDGSIIPLSERFDPNNDDIRYSLPTTDTNGNVLSDGQMEYFKNSLARDEKGRLVPVFHTTNYGGFTIFDPSYSDDKRSLFFASNFDISQTYGHRANKPIKLNYDMPHFNSLDEFNAYATEHWSDLGWKADENFAVNTDLQIYDNFVFAPVRNLDKAIEWVNGNGDYDKYSAVLKVPNENTGFWDTIKAKNPDDLVKEINKHYSQENRQRGYYEVYLNLENPLIVDAQGHNWNEIPFGPEGNGLEDHLAELEESSDMLIEEVYVIQGDYDKAGTPTKIDVQVKYRTKNGKGDWSAQQTFQNEYRLSEDEQAVSDIQFISRSVFLWEKAEEALYDLGLPQDYVADLEMNHIDFDGDINWYPGQFDNPITFDYINTKEEKYEIVDVYAYDSKMPMRTREIAEIAEDMGYDGVIIKNCIDIGGSSKFRGTFMLSDIYIAFASNQVKDTNNLNPTENPDIRYSIVDDDEAKSRIAYEDAIDDSYEALVRYEELIDTADPETYNFNKSFKEEDVAKFYASLRGAERVAYSDPVNEEDRVRMARSKEDFFNSLNAKWNDRWTTGGEVLNVKSVKTDIRNLVMGIMANSNTDSKYKNEIVRKTLFDARTAFQLMKQDRSDIASYLLYHSAQRMIENVEFYVDDEFSMYKGLRDYLRTTSLSLGEEYWDDVDYNAFRKRNFGRLKLVKGTTNVDQIYQELQSMYPEWFEEDETMSVPDQLLQIEHVLDSVQPYKEAYSSDAAAELAFDIADELYEIIAGGKEVRSLADTYKERYDAKTKAMKQRHAEAMLRMREAKDIGVKAERAKWQAREERRKEKTAHDKYFKSISKTHAKLTERLMTNTKDKNIPEQYKKELAGLLAAFDFQTVKSKKREAATYHRSQKAIKMSAIRSALRQIEVNSDMFHINDAITDIIDELLGENTQYPTANSIEGKTLDALSVDELKRIDDLLKALLHEFNYYESVRVGEKRQQAADIGKAQIDSALEHVQKFGAAKDYQNSPGWIDRILNLDEITPAYMFRRIDEDNTGLGLMWKEIRRGFDKYVRNQNQLNDWMDEIVGKYHQKGILWNKYGAGELTNWRSDNYARTFNFENGSVRLTPAQMMSIYCLANRPQAKGHLLGDGIVVAPVTFNAKILSDIKKRPNTALSVKLTDANIKEIVSKLTPDQIKVADQLQELMATKMADWGNEASMDVLGIKLFTEKEYFPIKSDKGALKKDLNASEFENAIRNFGFTKALMPDASNAILIEDIFDVVTEHCNNMNLYNAYSAAMNDFMKVFNYKEAREDGNKRTVQQAISQAYSYKATTFIWTFLRDLNGNVSGRASGIEDAYNSMLGNAKKAAVFTNLRVAAQQPTAITRAFYVIDPKYRKGIHVEPGAMKEMFEHCPIALWKSWGYYDINMGKSIEDIMMNNGRWLEDKATDLYGKLDNVTWTAIWQMVKAEMKDTHPDVKEGTDEYWDLCNERMSEIVDLTQVVDSPMHRSHAMRDKGFLKKTATAFMAEPTLTYNMIRDGYIRATEAARSGNKAAAAKIASKTLAVALLQAVAVAGAAGFVDALRHKNPDKDDDDRFLHLWWINFLNNAKDELKLWNKVYFIKDIAQIFEGWENSNLALQGIQKFALGYRQLTGDPYARSSASWWQNMADGLGYLFGVPVKTMRTGIKNAMQTLGIESPALDAMTERLDSMAGDKKGEDDVGVVGYLSLFVSDDISLKEDGLLSRFIKKAEKDAKTSDDKTSKEGKASSEETSESETLVDKYIEQEEKLDKLSDKAAKVSESTAVGYKRNEALWDALTDGYTTALKEGDVDYIKELEKIYKDNGGDMSVWESNMTEGMKRIYKQTLNSDATLDQIYGQSYMQNYMLEHGVTAEEISDMCYHSYMAKDLKAAMRMNNEQYIMDELVPLVMAGLSEADFEKAWKYRNRYQNYTGKYSDEKYLKSTGTYVWPAEGPITSEFGYRDAPTSGASTNHPAIDIGAAYGSPVVAADGGTVIAVGWNGGYGNQVAVQSDDGSTVMYYSHLSDWNVNVGDRVSQGSQIAQVGSTGNSTGPHLDFKVEVNGTPVNPLQYLNTANATYALDA